MRRRPLAACRPPRPSQTHDGWVVLYNPGSSPVRAVTRGLSCRDGRTPLTTVVIPAGGRASIHLNQLQPVLDEPLLVSASGPVYAELDVYGADGTPGHQPELRGAAHRSLSDEGPAPDRAQRAGLRCRRRLASNAPGGVPAGACRTPWPSPSSSAKRGTSWTCSWTGRP